MSTTIQLETPTIDVEKLQNKANEAAEAAYLKCIQDYYTGYNSPFKKKIEAELSEKSISWTMELPDIVARINEALSNEIDAIANRAVAESYIPYMSEMLTRVDKYIDLSTILKEIVDELKDEDCDEHDFSFKSYEEDSEYGWLRCELTTPHCNYEFTLHTGDDGRYQILSFPYKIDLHHKRSTMTIKRDDVSIEMPFTTDILKDKVMRLFMNLMLSKSQIKMDSEVIREEWFYNDCDY